MLCYDFRFASYAFFTYATSNCVSFLLSFLHRFAKKFFLNGTEYRTLTKAHGILFQIKITGEAGKFNIVPLMLNVASGCALLSVVS